MTARHLQINEENLYLYYHVYNQGVLASPIFRQEADYHTFLGFLKEYLTPRQNPENIKKTFIVNGRSFRGIPHQPNNYFGQVDLLAYSLKPDCFHLLLHELSPGAIEKLLRSLCTRYSIYFNRKYRRTGALYKGPYQSASFNDPFSLLYLTRHFHHPENGGLHTSFRRYLGLHDYPWIKPNHILNFFSQIDRKTLKVPNDYRDFVEKYSLSPEEKKMLERIILEKPSPQSGKPLPPATTSDQPAKTTHKKDSPSPPTFIQISLFASLFALLFTFGIKNIREASLSAASVPESAFSPAPILVPSPPLTPSPQIAGSKDEKEPSLPSVEIDSTSTGINIRRAPDSGSEKIGLTQTGDIYEIISLDSGWYQIRLPDGSPGFIAAEYFKIPSSEPFF